VLWTAGGLLALAAWLWNLRGREEVTASADAFEVRRAVGRFGRTRRFRRADVHDVRATPYDEAEAKTVAGATAARLPR
jgi:hypothetical protein